MDSNAVAQFLERATASHADGKQVKILAASDNDALIIKALMLNWPAPIRNTVQIVGPGDVLSGSVIVIDAIGTYAIDA